VGTIVIKDQPCLDQVMCASSDAMQVYEDGGARCFSCDRQFTKEQVEKGLNKTPKVPKAEKEYVARVSLSEVPDLPIRGFQDRKITKDVAEFFGIHVSYNDKGDIDAHYYPYGDGYNIRIVDGKKFTRLGTLTELCGQTKFSGGGKRLIITEGEIDMCSVALASQKRYSRIYPVVTMGSATNVKLLIEQREWVRSFDEVILWFDNDTKGKEALDKAIKIIGIDKVKVASHPTCKDANEVHCTLGIDAVMQPIFDAAPVIPSGIITRSTLKERMRAFNETRALPYPDCMAGVNSKLKGMRFGEITLFTSGTGSGKSTLLREIILHIKKTAPVEDKIGIASLEESPEAEARRLSGMQLSRNTSDEEMSFEELEVGFNELFGSEDEEERIMMLDHQGAVNDSSIIDKIEYMCLMGCRYILIDHITILVSEGIDKLHGNEAQDKIMNDLLALVKKYPVWIGLVSHLRKVGQGAVSFEQGKIPTMDDIKGSGSIKQISFDIIGFARDMNAEDDNTRNTINMAVLKARTTGLTGIVRGAMYNQSTGRLTAIPVEDEFTKVETTWVKP